MNYGLILAGGKGTRMGNTDLPKQFLDLQGEPVIIHTIEKFGLFKDEVERLIITCPKEWITYTTDIIKKKWGEDDWIVVTEGGGTRHESILNGLNFIKANYKIGKEDIIITHDAVRPFVSYRIIKENIEKCKSYHAVDTVIPATDTIVHSVDGNKLSSIPPRKEVYQGQTPQTFNIEELLYCYNNLDKETIELTTDAAKLFLLLEKDVYIAFGDDSNIKLTTPTDLVIANAMLRKDKP
ncbi:IspD/TarI family cytidylyltransferase [Priestia megaterium]|uniref:IspD/TarI family cytidylyltransferase n=1 Tax=Priestia megaterium TaxID=1404 RepID=UPI002783276C|nr:2-C-methyl-D-erythritol 4-phosphate cytidylyltransferase [Priestia megaterium]MDQ0803464.1 2-C-methyl-D-erythritol 4-phosphate cytidylyltransferase [Priestia megaterium]